MSTTSKTYDVVIIGAGPAGYVAAIRCAQLGLRTACVDDWREPGGPALGGTCLNAGCIPSKALLDSSEFYRRVRDEPSEHGIRVQGLEVDIAAMMARKKRVVQSLTEGIATLFQSNRIDWLAGRARLLEGRRVEFTPHGAESAEILLDSDHVILASGSRPTEFSAAPIDGELIVDSRGALEFSEVPKRLGVIGAGVIGLELGSVWSRFGAEVVMLEAQDTFLSMLDHRIAHEAFKVFTHQGLDIRLSARVVSSEKTNGQVMVKYLDANEGEHELTVDRLLVAVGRVPYTDGLAAPEAGLLLDERGFVHVDEQYSTNLPGVYAVGDVIHGPMLAHKGSEEGIAVAEMIATGEPSGVNYDTIPSVLYTNPEIAWVGRSEQALKAMGIPVRIGTFSFAASGRARVLGESLGSVKILAHAETDRLLGVHIMGPEASELIAEAVLAMEFGASSEDLARTVHAHPTLSEAVHEAALAVEGRAIHSFTRKASK